jgi:hypothetical protein
MAKINILEKSWVRGYEVRLVLASNSIGQKYYMWAHSNGFPAQIGHELSFTTAEEAIDHGREYGMVFKSEINRLLKNNGFWGNEILRNPRTVATQTSRAWAMGALKICQCDACKNKTGCCQCPDFLENNWTGNASDKFSLLKHVRKNRSGDYEVV